MTGAPLPRVVRWRDQTGTGGEHLILTAAGGGVRADSVVLSPRGVMFAACYCLTIDDRWRVRRLQVEVIGSGGGGIDLRSDGCGQWHAASGGPADALAGAVDVDLALTPFTNTLPIRRLSLAVGQAAEIDPVYVTAPDLAVSRLRQRYTRMADRVYRYESIGHGFIRDLVVDEHGLVLDYPGLFRRSDV